MKLVYSSTSVLFSRQRLNKQLCQVFIAVKLFFRNQMKIMSELYRMCPKNPSLVLPMFVDKNTFGVQRTFKPLSIDNLCLSVIQANQILLNNATMRGPSVLTIQKFNNFILSLNGICNNIFTINNVNIWFKIFKIFLMVIFCVRKNLLNSDKLQINTNYLATLWVVVQFWMNWRCYFDTH